VSPEKLKVVAGEVKTRLIWGKNKIIKVQEKWANKKMGPLLIILHLKSRE